MVSARWLVIFLTFCLAADGWTGGQCGVVWAAEAPDHALEIQAREAFAAGRYDEALNRFAKLYAQTLHPVYLRNIGRCHQKMREPQKAIDAFRDYLAKGKNIPAEERAEIEGYIKEMEALTEQQRQQQEQERDKDRERAARLAAAQNSGATTAVPGLVPPTQESPVINVVSDVPGAPPSPASAGGDGVPFYKKWWFWTAVGVVAAGTGATVFLLTRSTCPKGVPCK